MHVLSLCEEKPKADFGQHTGTGVDVLACRKQKEGQKL